MTPTQPIALVVYTNLETVECIYKQLVRFAFVEKQRFAELASQIHLRGAYVSMRQGVGATAGVGYRVRRRP